MKKKEAWEKLEDSKARGDVRRRKLNESGSERQTHVNDINRKADTSRRRILREDIDKDHEAFDGRS